jgi:hypothetical protein
MTWTYFMVCSPVFPLDANFVHADYVSRLDVVDVYWGRLLARAVGRARGTLLEDGWEK